MSTRISPTTRSTSTEFAAVWRPGVRWMGQLQLAGKALLISLVFLVPIVILSLASLMDYQVRRNANAAELGGVQTLRSYVLLNQYIIGARNATRATLGGFDASQAYKDSRSHADALFAQASQDLQANGDPLNLQAPLAALQKKWDSTATSTNGLDATGQSTVLAPVTTAVAEFLQLVSDRAGLVLDPDVDSLYLSLLSIQLFPALMENLGQLRSWSTYVVAGAAFASRWSIVLVPNGYMNISR